MFDVKLCLLVCWDILVSGFGCPLAATLILCEGGRLYTVVIGAMFVVTWL
jgi:hypothetical protein